MRHLYDGKQRHQNYAHYRTGRPRERRSAAFSAGMWLAAGQNKLPLASHHTRLLDVRTRGRFHFSSAGVSLFCDILRLATYRNGAALFLRNGTACSQVRTRISSEFPILMVYCHQHKQFRFV